jgi:hypothetical protein
VPPTLRHCTTWRSRDSPILIASPHYGLLKLAGVLCLPKQGASVIRPKIARGVVVEAALPRSMYASNIVTIPCMASMGEELEFRGKRDGRKDEDECSAPLHQFLESCCYEADSFRDRICVC